MSDDTATSGPHDHTADPRDYVDNGLILIGWSSGFLLSVTSRLRLLEHEWESYTERNRKV